MGDTSMAHKFQLSISLLSAYPSKPSQMRTFWYDGRLDLRRGDVVRILKAIVKGDEIRATRVENVSKGSSETSKIDGVLMSDQKVEFDEPIVGRVISVNIRSNNVTYVDIEEGVITDDQVFIQAGEPDRGIEVLAAIIANEVEDYLKVCDPYVSTVTLDLLARSPRETRILLLTNNIHGRKAFDTRLAELSRRGIVIRTKVLEGFAHGRYMLTQGRGWTVDHSLKDFGKKDSLIHRLKTSSELEENFDKRWTRATTL
jgi:hypothetical protein